MRTLWTFILSCFVSILNVYCQADTIISSRAASVSDPVAWIEGSFSVTPQGQASYEVPIQIPAGTGGLAPRLSVSYDSSRKLTGLVGYGFDLKGLSIINRSPSDMYHDGEVGCVSFTSSDHFTLDGVRLVPVGNYAAYREYRKEIDDFSRIRSYGLAANPDSFVVNLKNGLKYTYLPNRKLVEPNSSDVGLFWMVARVEDTCGNYYTVSYTGNPNNNVPLPDNTIYPSRIDYTGNTRTGLVPYASVRIVYEENSNFGVTYVSGRRVRHDKFVKNIDAYYGDSLVRSYAMTYTTHEGRKVLSRIDEMAGDDTRKRPAVFEWNYPTSSETYVTDDSGLHNVMLAVGDYNGDGLSDFVSVPRDRNAGWKTWRLYLGSQGDRYPDSHSSGTMQFNDDVLQVASGDFNGDGYDDFAVLRFFQYNGQSPTNYTTTVFYSSVSGHNVSFAQSASNLYHSYQPYTLKTIETDGDGMADLLICFSSSSSYKVLRSLNGQPLSALTSGTSPTGNPWNRIEPIDHNGDGKTDLLIGYTNSYYLLTASGSGTFTSAELSLGSSYDWHAGDFNGDGKTDFLVTSSDGLEMSLWYVYMSDGTGRLLTISFSSLFQALAHDFIVADINGDGFDDFYAIPKSSSGSSVTPRAYINDGTGRFHQMSLGSTVVPVSRGVYYLGNFSGCGKNELLCTSNGVNTTWDGFKLYRLPYMNGLLLSKITDGPGNDTEIIYDHYYNSLTADSVFESPIMSYRAPLTVVSRFATPDGLGGKKWTRYSYENALYHHIGRGFLGFQKVTVRDNAWGAVTTEYTVNRAKYVLDTKATTVKASSRRIKESEYQYNSLSASDSVFSRQLVSSVERNYEYLTLCEVSELHTATEYDSHGNPTMITTYNGETTTVTTNTYADNEERWLLGRLSSSQVTKTGAAGSSEHHAQFVYDPVTGLLTEERTEPDNTQFGMRKVYNRDLYGNILSSTQVPYDSSLPSRTSSTTYDARGRFLVTQTNALGHTVTHQVEAATGKLLSSTDANGITTTYKYDSFGRITRVASPLGTTYTSMGWCAAQTGLPTMCYYVLTHQPSKPLISKYYDCLGRLVRTVTTDQFRYTNEDVVYNEQGFVVQTSKPYNVMEDEEPVWNTMVYDRANRLVTHTDAAGHTTRYLYNERTTFVADALGGFSSRTVDASGNLSYCIDQAGDSVVYSYDVDGHCTMVRGGGKTILMEYDLMGNRTLLDDPDMGQKQTQYNAYGELIRQTDDKGTTTWNYDNLGRVVQETRPDMTTTSVYDTRFIGALTSQTVSNGTGMSYQYDEYGRVTSKESVIGNRTFLTQTYYTPYNQVACIKYPSGLRIGYTYSLWGNLLQVTDYDSDELLWELDSLNARGQVTSQIYGNTKEIHTSYDPTNGRIVGIRTNGIQDWTYVYDALGNLTERKDCSRNLTETFDYDLRNRLVRTSRNSLSTQLMTYDAAGNLLSKTGVGHDFAYEEGSNRLISFYADSPLPRMWDDIQYSSFHKVTSIVQGSHSLALTYGPSKSRMKAVLSDHQTVAETKYYIDNLYEEIQKGAEVTQLSYIFAGDVCIAIHEHSSTNGTRLLYLHHDHLGSVQAYSDEQGHLVQELSYDAWGCRRSPDTWEPFERFTEAGAANPWGFTGHEHLDLFEMVNMEGRIYDPLLGRFLSPDPYVQAPDYTQSLNRYVYCLNNPLSLTDPTGEFWWTPIAIAAAIFATGNTVSHAVRGDIHSVGDGLKYFGQGTLAGAALGATWQFAPSIPFVGSILKTSMSIYGYAQLGSTALGAVGIVSSTIDRGWNGFWDGCKLVLGNFYIDENASFFEGALQGTLRHTWEMPQNALGYAYSQFKYASLATDRVDFLGGATFSTDYTDNRNGVTMGSYINIDNPEHINGYFDDYVLSNPLYMHEYGHVIQSRIFGFGFLPIIGAPSLFSAWNSEKIDEYITEYNIFWTETAANRESSRYFGKHYGINWDETHVLYKGIHAPIMMFFPKNK